MVEELRKKEINGPVRLPKRDFFTRGQKLKVKDPWHILSGYDLEFAGMPTRERVRVMLEWFGRRQTTALPIDSVVGCLIATILLMILSENNVRTPCLRRVASWPICRALNRLWHRNAAFWSGTTSRSPTSASFPSYACFIVSVPAFLRSKRRASRFFSITNSPKAFHDRQPIFGVSWDIQHLFRTSPVTWKRSKGTTTASISVSSMSVTRMEKGYSIVTYERGGNGRRRTC